MKQVIVASVSGELISNQASVNTGIEPHVPDSTTTFVSGGEMYTTHKIIDIVKPRGGKSLLDEAVLLLTLNSQSWTQCFGVAPLTTKDLVLTRQLAMPPDSSLEDDKAGDITPWWQEPKVVEFKPSRVVLVLVKPCLGTLDKLEATLP